MKHKVLHWKTRDDIEIYGQYWRSDQPERAVIAVVHGFGEHSGRYGHVAAAFADAGYSTIAFDHRGHGRSGGQRGHTPHYESLLQDVDLLLQKTADQFPDLPVILYGHSMGGNIVINHLIRRQPEVAGAVVTGPFLSPGTPVPAFQLALGRLMNRIWGAYPDRAKIDPRDISRDEQEVMAYIGDKLIHNRISARLGISLLDNGSFALEHASDVRVPMIVLHGEADRIADCNASRSFADRAGGKVDFESFPGLYHEIHNELEKQEVLNVIVKWCDHLMNRHYASQP